MNVVKCQIKYIDGGRTITKIKILEAMRMLVRSWDPVSANIVKNCCRKAGISEQTQVPKINDEDDPFKLLEENVNDLRSRGLVDGDLTIDDYVNIDFEVCTRGLYKWNKCYDRSRNFGQTKSHQRLHTQYSHLNASLFLITVAAK